ncbi:MAG: discoidin domain-containing protein [Clostridiaceae bacterium]
MINLALNRPISSDYGYYLDYTPNKAVDGNLNPSDGFMDVYLNQPTLIIELDKPYKIEEVRLKQLIVTAGRCKDFELKGSLGGINYTSLLNGILLSNEELQAFNINSEFKYKYISFKILNNYGGANKSNGICEIEIYGHSYKHLIKQSDQFYSIKPEYYEGEAFKPITLSSGDYPIKADFDIKGFDDLNDLLKERSGGSLNSNGTSLDSGKMFSFDFGSDFKSIINIE